MKINVGRTESPRLRLRDLEVGDVFHFEGSPPYTACMLVQVRTQSKHSGLARRVVDLTNGRLSNHSARHSEDTAVVLLDAEMNVTPRKKR